MHARFLMMNLGPGMRATATGMADEAYKTAKGLPGFVSATYLVFDEAKGDYGSLTVWKSEADANAAAATLMPWFEKAASGKLKAPPVIRIAEVYEPR